MFKKCELIAAIISISLLIPIVSASALTFETTSKNQGTSTSAKCDPRKGKAFIFDDPKLDCVNPRITSNKERLRRSQAKDGRAYAAYFNLKNQADALDLPINRHLFEHLKLIHDAPEFYHRPNCKVVADQIRNWNRQWKPVYLPDVLTPDVGVYYASEGDLFELMGMISRANAAIIAGCQAGSKQACNKVVTVLKDAAENNRVQFDKNVKWRPQLAFYSNTLIILPLLVGYSDAISLADNWDEDTHNTIGKWLGRVVHDADEYKPYASGYKSGQVYRERKAIANHGTSQAAARMAYGILWQDAERVVEALNMYKYRLETIRPDGSMPSETERGAMALFYQNVGVRDVIIIAEMAASIGVDLYSYENKAGQTIHDLVGYVVKSVIDENLVRGYAKYRKSEGWGEQYWPNFVRDKDFLGQRGGWYAFYKKRFPDSPIHEIIEGDKSGRTFLYSDEQLQSIGNPSAIGNNPICLTATPEEKDDLIDIENQIFFSEQKRTWSVEFNDVAADGEYVTGQAKVYTIIKQRLPVRNFTIRFKVSTDLAEGSIALLEGVTNDGNLDSSGDRFSFRLSNKSAKNIQKNCGEVLYSQKQMFFPTFDLRDVLQTKDRDAPLRGLSEQARCQIRFAGQYGYANTVDILSLVARGLTGDVEDGYYFDAKADAEIIKKAFANAD